MSLGASFVFRGSHVCIHYAHIHYIHRQKKSYTRPWRLVCARKTHSCRCFESRSKAQVTYMSMYGAVIPISASDNKQNIMVLVSSFVRHLWIVCIMIRCKRHAAPPKRDSVQTHTSIFRRRYSAQATDNAQCHVILTSNSRSGQTQKGKKKRENQLIFILGFVLCNEHAVLTNGDVLASTMRHRRHSSQSTQYTTHNILVAYHHRNHGSKIRAMTPSSSVSLFAYTEVRM